MFNYTDFYIKNINEPTYVDGSLIEDDIINVIIQKYQMILFTNKGEIFGDPNFGANLELLLHQTKVSDEFVKNEIFDQIANYIPELNNIPYNIDVVFTQDLTNYSDNMFIKFKISDFEVYAQFN